MFRAVAEAAHDAIITADHRRCVLYFNPSAERIFGYQADEVVGRSLTVLIPSRYGAHEQALERLLDTDDAGPLRRTVELVGKRCDGAEFPIELSIASWSFATRTFFTVIGRDITERKAAEDELRQQNASLGALHETRLDLINRLDLRDLLEAVLTRAGALVRAQHGYVSTLHPTGKVTVQAALGAFKHLQGLELKLSEDLASGGRESVEPLIVDSFESWWDRPTNFPHGLNGSAVLVPLKTRERIIGMLGLVHVEEGRLFGERDIALLEGFAELASIAVDTAQRCDSLQEELSEQRWVETTLRGREDQLARSSDAKSEFLTHMSHELRSPLSSMLIAAEMLADSAFGPVDEARVRDLSGKIVGGGRHLLALIDDLLDLSLIESGRLDLRPQVVSLEALLQEVREVMEPVAAAKGVTLHVPSGHDHRLLADPVRFRQVLLNLLTNAIKFTDPGGRVWMEISASADDISIRVCDTGIGIAPKDLERIFEPFEQASGMATSGAGLGLAISRRIINAHGGTLTVSSIMGGGSAFSITLEKGAGDVSAPVETASHGETVRRGDASVLLVEDDPTILELAKDVLRGAGYQVGEAITAMEALARVRNERPELVLLDVRLGNADGLEVVRRIRRDPLLQDVTVVGLSANAMPQDVERALAAGCDSYLVKPISARALLARVSEFVATRP